MPIKLKIKGKEVDFAVDEHPRPQTKIEGLSKLPTIFKKDGTVTAGSASVSILIPVTDEIAWHATTYLILKQHDSLFSN